MAPHLLRHPGAQMRHARHLGHLQPQQMSACTQAAIDQLATSGGLLLTKFSQQFAYKHAYRCLSAPCAPPRTCPMWRGSCGNPVKIFCRQRCGASFWSLHRHTAHSVSTLPAGSLSTALSALIYTASAAPICHQLTDGRLLPIFTLVRQKKVQTLALQEVDCTLLWTDLCARYSLEGDDGASRLTR